MQWSEYTTSERLKALRGGMTQEQLAEAASVSVGVVRKLERGGTASLPSLLFIADALGTNTIRTRLPLVGSAAPTKLSVRGVRATPASSESRELVSRWRRSSP
ncbi:helix-turn-helix domain-containing protein [Streptomyces halstedii]|uniref:helix-turn-helix domain-containing protein n=1 Tax=Streptomyces halstedii TaxID=1944 RepID=UPI0037FBA968